MNDGGYLAVSPHNPDVVFCTGNIYPSSVWNIAVSRTTDGGTSWKHDTLAYGSNGFAVAFDPVDSNRVYVAGDSAYNYGNAAFLVSTDRGQTWASSRAGLSGRVWSVAVNPDDPAVIYCGTYRGVYKSTDRGANWSATAFTRDTRTLTIDPDNPNVVYAGTYGYGVSVTTNGGGAWSEVNAGLTCNKVMSLALRGGAEPMLFAGTEGGAVFRMLPPTGVFEPVGRGPRPAAVTVLPNPCRGKARLDCPVVTGPAAAALFDHSGRLVRDFGARPAAGVDWSADLRGVPAGTYFVRVTAGGRTHVARLVVMD